MESGSRAYRFQGVKQSVYFFLWGITRDMSFISSITGSLLLAAVDPLLLDSFCEELWDFDSASLDAGLVGRSWSNRRFLELGSDEGGGDRDRM